MVDKIAGAAVQGATEAAKAPKVESFSKAMQGARLHGGASQPGAPQAHQPVGAVSRPRPAQPAQPSHPVAHARPAPQAAKVQAKPEAKALINEVAGAQAKLDQLLKLAESGRTFSPAELLAFQAHAYRASQELDLAGKVVEKATSGVKQTLNTQV